MNTECQHRFLSYTNPIIIDHKTNKGLKFYYSNMEVDDIENVHNIDLFFDVEDQYVKKVEIGVFAICEIPNDNWKKAVTKCKTNVFLHTNTQEWLWLKRKRVYNIEVEGMRKNVWICKIITFNDLLNMTCLQNKMTDEGKNYYNSTECKLDTVEIIYGRCVKSMTLLDKLHRKYVKNRKFKKNDILAIKSVAGSGKTTTLLDLAKIHKNKKILYLAFNKSLMLDIKKKKQKQKIKNLHPKTFDSLMFSMYIKNKGMEPNIMDLKVQTIHKVIPWFSKQYYNTKKYYVKHYTKFCQQNHFSTMKDYCLKELGCEKPLLLEMWSKTLADRLITFDSIRKLAQINNWCKDYIDKEYDMIFVDEAQDFDNIMLSILLDDTTIPKIFVGDPRQAIYKWRGCINAFEKLEHLPNNIITIEFYSTFRIGEPACEKIRTQFQNCWMISKSKNNIFSTKC